MPKLPTELPPKEMDADFSEAEIARRRDEAVRRMLNTAPSPQKPKGKGKASAPRKKKKASAKA